MKIDNQNIFPTSLFLFEFNKEEIFPLIEEINSKKLKIKDISKFYSSHVGIGKHYTDYGNPIRLIEYEKIMLIISNFFINQNKFFNLENYWSAFYYENSVHTTHGHSDPNVREPHNYSCVLYLTDNGGTTFFTSNSTSNDCEFFIKSKVGKLVIFPKTLLHSGVNKEKGERIIISSNIGIYNA